MNIHFLKRALFIAGLACLSLLATLPAHADDAVFNAFGGKEKIASLVNDFTGTVLADPRIKAKFEDYDIDLDRLKKQLTSQFCELTGGPCHFSGKSMKEIHAKLGITNANFNALAEDLQAAMERAGIPNWAQNKLLAKLAPMQRDIVTK